MARNRHGNISRESFHPTDFNDVTSDAADVDALDSILDDFSRTTADFGMMSNQSLDDSKKEELASDMDTPGIGESSTPLSSHSQADRHNLSFSPINDSELFRSPAPHVEMTGQSPNANTSIQTVAAEIDNLASKVENLCSLADLFEEKMEKVCSHIESLEQLLVRVVRIERAAMERYHDLP